jgi:hypothetical protein
MLDVGFMNMKNNVEFDNRTEQVVKDLRMYFYNWQT